FESGPDFDARAGAHENHRTTAVKTATTGTRPYFAKGSAGHRSRTRAHSYIPRVPAKYPTLRTERKFWETGDRIVVGIDEVGRGSWAGPVTVAAVVPAEQHLSG